MTITQISYANPELIVTTADAPDAPDAPAVPPSPAGAVDAHPAFIRARDDIYTLLAATPEGLTGEYLYIKTRDGTAHVWMWLVLGWHVAAGMIEVVDGYDHQVSAYDQIFRLTPVGCAAAATVESAHDE